MTTTWRDAIDERIAKLEALSKPEKIRAVLALAEDRAFIDAMAREHARDRSAVGVAMVKLGTVCHGAGKAVTVVQSAIEDRSRALRNAVRRDEEEAPRRPVMVVANNLHDIACQSMPHLERGGQVYQRGRSLVYIARDGSPFPWLTSKDPFIRIHTSGSLAVEFNRVCDTAEETVDRRGNVQTVIRPCPPSVPSSIIGSASWPFRALEGISRIPIIRPDGEVYDEPGYDPMTGYVYEPDPTLTLAIPETVTQDMARKAVADLLDPFVDFPFAMVDGFTFNQSPYRSAVVAAILTVIARPGIRGCVPFFVFSATTPKSGKTLLVDLIYAITSGHAATRMAPVEREEEMEKRITSVMMAGLQAVLVDNVVRLGGPSLDAVATAYPRYMGRVLGTSEMPEVPALTVWFYSGNNIAWIGDILQRIIPIHLEPDCENPENRSGFRHDQVMQYVTAHRGRLLSAAYTIIRGWHQAGRPMAKLPRMGAYEVWSDIVRQAMVWAGLTDPYLGVAPFKITGDDAKSEAVSLFTAWYSLYGPREMALATIAKNVTADNPATQEMWACVQPWVVNGKVDTIKLGHWLRHSKGRIFGGFRATPHIGRGAAAGWSVSQVVRAEEGREPDRVSMFAGAGEDDGGPLY